MITEVEELDQEADRLADRLEEYVKDKRKRDFEILLLKGDIEKRKKYPLGVPPGPSPEYLQEQRKREAEKARKDEEFQRKCEEEEENEPLMVCLKEVKANLAIDRDYYRKQRQAEAAQDADRWRRAAAGRAARRGGGDGGEAMKAMKGCQGGGGVRRRWR